VYLLCDPAALLKTPKVENAGAPASGCSVSPPCGATKGYGAAERPVPDPMPPPPSSPSPIAAPHLVRTPASLSWVLLRDGGCSEQLYPRPRLPPRALTRCEWHRNRLCSPPRGGGCAAEAIKGGGGTEQPQPQSWPHSPSRPHPHPGHGPPRHRRRAALPAGSLRGHPVAVSSGPSGGTHPFPSAPIRGSPSAVLGGVPVVPPTPLTPILSPQRADGERQRGGLERKPSLPAARRAGARPVPDVPEEPGGHAQHRPGRPPDPEHLPEDLCRHEVELLLRPACPQVWP